jgi:hypothetical protein
MLESSPQNKNSRRLCRDSSRCGPRLRLRWLFRNGIVFLRFDVRSMVGKYEVGVVMRRAEELLSFSIATNTSGIIFQGWRLSSMYRKGPQGSEGSHEQSANE